MDRQDLTIPTVDFRDTSLTWTPNCSISFNFGHEASLILTEEGTLKTVGISPTKASKEFLAVLRQSYTGLPGKVRKLEEENKRLREELANVKKA